MSDQLVVANPIVGVSRFFRLLNRPATP